VGPTGPGRSASKCSYKFQEVKCSKCTFSPGQLQHKLHYFCFCRIFSDKEAK
jgi:hypothetical protein